MRLLPAFLAAIAGAALACELPPGQRVEGERYALAFQIPAVEVGKIFSFEFTICPKVAAGPPESVRVDAGMPEHRHGMNYRSSVTTLGAGRYRAEGMMFHMPGRWELVFELRARGRTDRLAKSIVLE